MKWSQKNYDKGFYFYCQSKKDLNVKKLKTKLNNHRHDHPTKEKIFLFLDGSDDEKDAGNDIDNG